MLKAVRDRFQKLFFITGIIYTSLGWAIASSPSEINELIVLNKKPADDHGTNIWEAETIRTSLNDDDDIILEAKKIVLAKDVKISWEGAGALILKAENDIEFQEGSEIKSLGRGGLLLYPNSKGTQHKASVIFPRPSKKLNADEHKYYIDFSASTGSLYLFYNPVQGEKTHRYQNPIPWEQHIKVNAGLSYLFKDFMFINTLDDLKNLQNDGNYVLSVCSPRISLDLDTPSLPINFKGCFLYNNHSFYVGYYDGYKFPRGSHDLFCKNLSNPWYHHILKFSLPLLKEERKIFDSIEKGDLTKFRSLLQETLNKYDYKQEKQSKYLNQLYINEKGETLLHVAIRGQHESIAEFILQNCSQALNKFSHDGAFYLPELLKREDFLGNTPLDLATKYCTSGLIAKLYDKYLACNIPPSVQNLRKHVEERQSTLTDILNLFNTYKESAELIGKYWKGIPSCHLAREEEARLQQEVEKRFFAIKYETTELKACYLKSKKIFDDFSQKYAKKDATLKYNIEGLSSRSRIILLYNISLKKHDAYMTDQSSYFSDQKDKFPVSYMYANHTYTVDNNPTSNQPGNVFFKGLNTYEEIGKQIENLLTERKDLDVNKLANIFHLSRVSGNPINPRQLLQIGYTNLKEAAQDAIFFNKLQFLLDLEVARRLIEGDLYSSLTVGLTCARHFALSQATSIPDREINFFNIFYLEKESNLFKGKINQRAKIKSDINERFHRLAKECRSLRRVSNNQDWENIKTWERNHPYDGLVIATAEEMHQELLEEYGGGYESEGEEYNF